ncbi:hypothetical protein UFOVP828_165 [uncultured Caudovirales phage]|uniref:Uncharacterized protein n=1 Tax=uncultured Caudovirales phage TaxID=2100421 RepID=A0A6J5P4F1_9CAUD|nr:hypothetical protein UFOVP828_165 [uncultured Caudovirales phage]
MNTSTQYTIANVCDNIKNMLIDKNKSYGDSALDPIRIFSKANSDEQIKIRIDDKLSRISRGSEFYGDNDLDDLIGYLILLKVSKVYNKEEL